MIAKHGFHPKEAFSIVFHWLIIEVAELTWADVTGIKSRDTYTFHWYCYSYQSLSFLSHRSIGVAMTSIQTFSEVWSLNVTWWPDPNNLSDLVLRFYTVLSSFYRSQWQRLVHLRPTSISVTILRLNWERQMAKGTHALTDVHCSQLVDYLKIAQFLVQWSIQT